MPFSKTTKEKALVAAGRRCCLCSDFKGVRLEVHHIEAESADGSNDFDNAIPLCFDCHADVGHYNPEHPRGNRYSDTELRGHRDRLYDQIRSGHLSPAPRQEEWAYCRYLVCKSFSALSEIVNGNLDRTPVASPLLADTIALAEMRHLVHVQGSNHRAGTVHGDRFPNAEAYYAQHSSVQIPQDSDARTYPYFDAIRMLDEAEIRMRVGPSDPMSVYLLDAGAPPEDVCVALGHDDACGGGFQELYETRAVWTAFLEIMNISNNAVTLGNLYGVVLDATEPSYRSFVGQPSSPWSMQLPSAAILPTHSVLVPLGVLLAPLKESLPAAIRGESHELAHAHYQQVDRVDYSSVARRMGLVGSMIWPSSITAGSGNASLTQQFHELDLSRVYTIDRYWAMGSCPFLFFRSDDGSLEYVRELFGAGVATRSCDTITVPSGVRSIIVAELERETTYMESVSVNGRHQSIDLELHRGDCWEVSVGCDDEIQLVGWYSPELPGRQEALYHNQLICNFITDQETTRSRQPMRGLFA